MKFPTLGGVAKVRENQTEARACYMNALTKAKDLLSHFEVYELLQIPRVENGYADALSKLASSRDSDLMKAIPVEKLSRPSIDESLAPTTMTISKSLRWMKEISHI
ncbi:protein nynrin-like [Abeliophyllum distichum]|uniref:Protein nynrin-like n=1 Tax=Abeliophyllum distichum TaxID=126358 RepID=A0ABD1PER2_9LAMI